LVDPSEVLPVPESICDAAGTESPLESRSSDLADIAYPKVKSTPLYRPSPTSVGTAIVLTSFFFAGLHYAQWPAPIPIFLLALGLGLVYHRTGSLLAVICMHAVFNASSTLALIYALMMGVTESEEEKVPPPAIQRDAPEGKVKPLAFDVARRPDWV
jgi:hypothetical protein